VKVTDEFMNAVKEEKRYGRDRIIIYRKKNKQRLMRAYQKDGYFYSLGIPNKDIRDYEELKVFDSYALFSQWMEDQLGKTVSQIDLKDSTKRDVYGDYLVETEDENQELAIHFTGDFLLYFGSDETNEIRELVKARDVWDTLIESNYRTAEPGLMFWTKMSRYSPSNYVGRPIICTNPCAEVPLEDGGACNLGSVNLARFVKNGFMDSASIDWENLEKAVYNLVRFLDNVVSWNQVLNPLEKQRDAAGETRRLGVGIMGIADMLYQLKIPYDSPEGVALMDKVMQFINNKAYLASSRLAKEKAPSDIFEYEDYANGPFFQEALADEVKEHIRHHGLRNIAITSIAPTGTISNIIRGVSVGRKNYIGVSGGVEPVFALFYTRRAESFDNQLFKVFHASVQAYIDMFELTDKVAKIETEEELRKFLPESFFCTAHHIFPERRIEIQSVCQKYVDHSISSTINLPEDIEPEVISNIYLKAWEKGLKGVTVYRDGSRFPILTADSKPSEFQAFKDKKFEVDAGHEKRIFFGDEVMRMPDGTLTTPFHYFRSLGIKNNQDIEVV
jgi:ribonucleoside-diphosphate reductase alpha chain